MQKLSKEEWDQLDGLLGKHGFGGYYDMLECLKMIIADLEKVTNKKVYEPKDLHDAVTLITGLSMIAKEEMLKGKEQTKFCWKHKKIDCKECESKNEIKSF